MKTTFFEFGCLFTEKTTLNSSKTDDYLIIEKSSQKFILIFLSLLMPNFMFGQMTCGGNIVIGTGVQTWIAPADITSSVTVQVWGAGGGGGSEWCGSATDGGGGGGGAFSSSTLTVTASTSYTLTVGVGGAIAPKGNSGSNAGSIITYKGGDGGDSWFGTATTVMAKGGKGGTAGTGNSASCPVRIYGTGGAGGQAASGFGTIKFSGGNGGSPIASGVNAGGASSAGLSANGTNGSNNQLGGIAPVGGGDGGLGGETTADPGCSPGGGAGGADNSDPSALGGTGQVILKYTTASCPTGITIMYGGPQSVAMTSTSWKTICSGTSVNLALTATVAAKFTWIATDNVNTTGESVTTQTVTTISNVLTNTTTTNQTVTYTVTPTITSNANCTSPGVPQVLSIVVNPQPIMTSTNTATICSGTALSIPLTATLASSFSWIAADNAGTTGESITTQTVTTISDVITSDFGGITSVTYSVTITATSSGCANTAGGASPQIITVTVNPAGYWTGNVDRDWFNTGNWGCMMPSCSMNAFIPTAPTGGRFPQIGASGAICKDLTISTGASLEFLTAYGLSVCGNWLNNGTFTPALGRATFTGTANQTIGGSVATNIFYNLTLSNTGISGNDNVTLNKPATVTYELNLSDGILVTTATNLLTLTNTANTATNDGNSTGPSFVSGPMRWNGLNGAGPFIFPTGKGSTRWARIGIQDLTAVTDFQAEYFNTAYTTINAASMATTPTPVLYRVSAKEYWTFSRVTGSGNGRVKLYWENAIWSGITACSVGSQLRISHWDSGLSKWQNNNNAVTPAGSCVGTSAGSITTDLAVSSFSPFTFGSISPGVNPLPVELLYFDATYNGKTIEVSWETASEINNDYFTVERSGDGVNFEAVCVKIPSKAEGGNSTSTLSYNLIDNKIAPGVYYYRLKQTDFNGMFKYSAVDVVEIKGSVDFAFTLVPNPCDGIEFNTIITADKDKEVLIVVYDVLGREMYSKAIVTEQKGNSVYIIDLFQKLNSGVYMITATSNQRIYSKRLIVN